MSITLTLTCLLALRFRSLTLFEPMQVAAMILVGAVFFTLNLVFAFINIHSGAHRIIYSHIEVALLPIIAFGTYIFYALRALRTMLNAVVTNQEMFRKKTRSLSINIFIVGGLMVLLSAE